MSVATRHADWNKMQIFFHSIRAHTARREELESLIAIFQGDLEEAREARLAEAGEAAVKVLLPYYGQGSYGGYCGTATSEVVGWVEVTLDPSIKYYGGIEALGLSEPQENRPPLLQSANRLGERLGFRGVVQPDMCAWGSSGTEWTRSFPGGSWDFCPSGPAANWEVLSWAVLEMKWVAKGAEMPKAA